MDAITGACYELLDEKWKRLSDPHAEQEQHAASGELTNGQQRSFQELCSVAPLAIVSYEEKQHEVQWLVGRAGYALVAGHLVSNQKVAVSETAHVDVGGSAAPSTALPAEGGAAQPDAAASSHGPSGKLIKPNFALLCNATTKHAVFSIRGTKNPQDAVVDLQAVPAVLGDASTDLISGKVHGK